MDLSIIIVSFNTKKRLEINLHTLFASEGDFKYEVFVVDNASSDGSAQMVANKFPQVKLIRNSNNLGFARANNQAIKLAKGDFILLLNPDMQVFPDYLINSLNWAKENPQAVVSGYRLVDKQGEVIAQVRRFPRLFDQLAIVLKLPHICPGILNNYILKNFNYDSCARVDSVRGSFFLINKLEFIKISKQEKPYLDERYFIWFEEVDFCRQVYQLGGEVWYSNQAKAVDYVGRSFSLLPKKTTQAYFKDSMIQYFSKWGKKYEVKILKFFWQIIGLFI